MNIVCFSGRLTYPDGDPYPHRHLHDYLPKVGLTVLDRMRSDCNMLVVSDTTLDTHKVREAEKLRTSGQDITTIPWPLFAEYFQIGGYAQPPPPRWWQHPNGALLCEVDDLFEQGERFQFVPSEPPDAVLVATPIGDPFRLDEHDHSPLAGRLVAVHEPVDN